MQVTTFPNNPTPPRGVDLDFGDGTCGRITLDGPQVVAGQPDQALFQAKGFQMDSSGNFVPDAAGRPVCTTLTDHPASYSGVRAKQQTIQPGWIKYRFKQGETLDPAALPSGWQSGTSDPSATGSVGDLYCNTTAGTFWQWDEGFYAFVHGIKAAELQQAIAANAGNGAF